MNLWQNKTNKKFSHVDVYKLRKEYSARERQTFRGEDPGLDWTGLNATVPTREASGQRRSGVSPLFTQSIGERDIPLQYIPERAQFR